MIEFEVSPSGTVRGIYKDELKETYEAIGPLNVKRASNVEWENYVVPSTGQQYQGWTVRAAHAPTYCFLRRSPMDGSIEVTVNGGGPPAFFPTREEALAEEVKHFWELLPPQKPPPPETTAVLTRAQFDALLEYSTSIPTGTTVGKQWKCNKAVARRLAGSVHTEEDWWLGEYIEEKQEPWKSKGYIGISWRKIVIRENA